MINYLSADPDLLVKILKAIDEKLFNDNVLGKHIRVLVEEWKKYVLIIIAMPLD